jgi:hypothetical protein
MAPSRNNVSAQVVFNQYKMGTLIAHALFAIETQRRTALIEQGRPGQGTKSDCRRSRAGPEFDGKWAIA